MKREIFLTRDGSPSLFVPELNETYHSRQGAITESRYVYIEQGLKFIAGTTNVVNILEFGLGTGLNVMLSFEYAARNQSVINYTTVEKFPLLPKEYAALNFESPEQYPWLFRQIHSCAWGESLSLKPGFTLKKIIADFADVAPTNTFHLIYYDAFAPSKQPEVWELNYLQKAFDLLTAGGVLVTYCSQGAFKRKLKELGFKVETLKGPPGKKEMVRAVKAGE